MADPPSRPSRAPQRSSHSDLLHTIAQLREQRHASAASTSSSIPSKSAPPFRSHSSRRSHAPGRRRLCKAGSNGTPAESTYNLSSDLEDWHDPEDSSNLGLSDSLEKLSIGSNNCGVSDDSKAALQQRQKGRILDSFAVLDEVSKFGATTKSKHEVIDVDDDEFGDLDTINVSDKDDDCETTLHIEKNSSGKFGNRLNTVTTFRSSEVCWEHADEKENTEAEAITLVNGKLVYLLPPNIAKILYPHQLEGIKWLWGLHVRGIGGILGDDMGLGKTMQIAAFLVGLFASDLIKRALVVAPKTLIAHWTKELTFVGLGKKTKDYSGTSASQRGYALQHVLQAGGVLLTTYDVVRNNWQALRGDFHGRDGFGDTSDDITTWDYMVLDEGHLIKNPSTQRAKSLKEIPCAHRIILSGTPIQNNLREMWALFDFCCPQLLGDKKEFKDHYEVAILTANSKDASDRQKRIGSTVAQELRKRIAPFFLRRMKSEVFPNSVNTEERKLSKKTDIIVWLRLTERQRELYTAFLESKTARQSLEGSALAALTVLKKICDHPSLLTQRAADDIAEGVLSVEDEAAAEAMSASMAKLLDKDEDIGSHEAVSCKIGFIMTLLQTLVDDGHRTLIFAQTRKMLDIIQNEIARRCYCFRRIDGTMKASDREKYVQEFQSNPAIPVFLLTSKVGGLGLTLTAADRVIIVDPAWNPSTDNQSVDRAYRIGQKQDVIIYRLMTSGTIEEKIYRKQVFKGGLSKVATEHKEQFRYFSHQELQELLTLPKTGFDISVTQQQLHQEHNTQYESDDRLRDHIKFLESLNIAGVSHHDLLFSKQAPELPSAEDDSWLRWDSQGWRYGKLESQPEIRSVTPHEWNRMNELKAKICESEESLVEKQKLEFCAQISRLSNTLRDKALISKLPDKGENLRRKLEQVTSQLENLKDVNSTGNNNICTTKVETSVVDSPSMELRDVDGKINTLGNTKTKQSPSTMKPAMIRPAGYQQAPTFQSKPVEQERCEHEEAKSSDSIDVSSVFAGLKL